MILLYAPVITGLDGLGHWLRVHPVRTAAALALAMLALAAVAILVHHLRHHPRVRQWRPERLSGRLRLPRYTTAALTLAALGSGLVLVMAFGYRGYRDVLLDEAVAPEELSPATTFGIDVSHYQARINWDAVAQSEHPIRFVFLRATMGYDAVDSRFRENWFGAAEAGFIRGAYHYFRPGEDGTAQFENFARAVDLQAGDLYPVLDIEELGRSSPERLRGELQEWLDLAEARWGVKPILYTGQTFYQHHLAGHYPDYPLWLAHYSATPDTSAIDWRIHQFSDRVRVKGILSRVDGNNFRGNLEALGALRL